MNTVVIPRRYGLNVDILDGDYIDWHNHFIDPLREVEIKKITLVPAEVSGVTLFMYYDPDNYTLYIQDTSW